MKLKVKAGPLRNALAYASHTLDTKLSSVGSWIYLVAKGGDKPRLLLYSTDLNFSETLQKIDAEVEIEGECLIRPKLLQVLIAASQEEDQLDLILNKDQTRLAVKMGGISSTLAVNQSAQSISKLLREIPFTAPATAKMKASTMTDIINQVGFCAATADRGVLEGPWLGSVQILSQEGGYRAIATDRRVAGLIQVGDPDIHPGFSLVLPVEALAALRALVGRKNKEEELEIVQDIKNPQKAPKIYFKFKDVILGVRLTVIEYPKQVEGIFAKREGYEKVIINKDTFKRALTCAAAFTNDSCLAFTMKDHLLTMQSRSDDGSFKEVIGLEEESANVNGAIGLAVPYLQAILNVVDSKNVAVEYKSQMDPAFFSDTDGTTRYFLSPIRITWQKAKASVDAAAPATEDHT